MKIKKIIRMPLFIEKYLLNNTLYLQEYYDSFYNNINSLDLVEYYNDKNERCFETNIYLSDMISFSSFYIVKSQLDYYYKCKYEDELNIPKSISNETFTVELDNEEVIDIFIEYSKFNSLIFIQSK